ncbi:phosphatidylglycerophosphatase A [bacterium]|nr:phosphatidylglycerophosphatase A [bacterium]
MSPAANRADASPLSVLIATLFGIGRIPKIPGTAASLVTLPLAHFLALSGFWPYLGICLLLTAVSIPICTRAEKALGEIDPHVIVLDEVVGMLIAYLPYAAFRFSDPWHSTLLAAFLLFRYFDIQKPLGIRSIQRLPGGLGIVIDDVAAGAAAAAIVGLLCGLAMLGTGPFLAW